MAVWVASSPLRGESTQAIPTKREWSVFGSPPVATELDSAQISWSVLGTPPTTRPPADEDVPDEFSGAAEHELPEVEGGCSVEAAIEGAPPSPNVSPNSVSKSSVVPVGYSMRTRGSSSSDARSADRSTCGSADNARSHNTSREVGTEKDADLEPDDIP